MATVYILQQQLFNYGDTPLVTHIEAHQNRATAQAVFRELVDLTSELLDDDQPMVSGNTGVETGGPDSMFAATWQTATDHQLRAVVSLDAQEIKP